MILDGRNKTALTEKQIEICIFAWKALCGKKWKIKLDISEADSNSSKTRYDEKKRKVFLGANVFPGKGSNANSRMSYLACLAHEYSHAMRHQKGYNRPLILPDSHLDEAETSIDASFHPIITKTDKSDLIEDARDRIINWIKTVGGNP